MKILSKTTLFCLFAILFLFSCGDDETMVVVDNDLNGTWTARSWTATISSSTTGGGINQSVESSFSGTSFDYDLVFDNGDFTTSGDYSYTFSLVGAGLNQTGAQDIDNVSGQGTYTNTDSQITLEGRIFEYSANGIMSVAATDEATVVDYEINADGDLVISYLATITDAQMGFTTVSNIVDQSVWERK